MKKLSNPNDYQEIDLELINSTLCDMMVSISKKSAEESHNYGIPTGFSSLDQIIGGLAPGSVNVIAARPSMGDKTLAFNIAMHVALAESLPIVIFSMEMSRMHIAMMLASQVARVDHWSLRNHEVAESDFGRLKTAITLIQEAKIYVDDSPELSAKDVYKRVLRIQDQHPQLGLIIIDNLQLMYLDEKRPGIDYRKIMRSLKTMANECNVPIIVLSGLSRKLENRENKRPLLIDLPAATIWKNADKVIFIYRDEIYNLNSQYRGIAEITIARNRNGAVGSTSLAFDGQFAAFTDRGNA